MPGSGLSRLESRSTIWNTVGRGGAETTPAGIVSLVEGGVRPSQELLKHAQVLKPQEGKSLLANPRGVTWWALGWAGWARAT
jgi:hypothetical protein